MTFEELTERALAVLRADRQARLDRAARLNQEHEMAKKNTPKVNVVGDEVVVRADENSVADAAARQAETLNAVERGHVPEVRDAAGSLVSERD